MTRSDGVGATLDETLAELRSSLAGTVIRPQDPEYDAARICFNGLIDRRPGVIVRCLATADVASALDYARANDLEVAVRGGGHTPRATASSTAGS